MVKVVSKNPSVSRIKNLRETVQLLKKGELGIKQRRLFLEKHNHNPDHNHNHY